jgi:hypothetical protein
MPKPLVPKCIEITILAQKKQKAEGLAVDFLASREPCSKTVWFNRLGGRSKPEG